MKCFEQYIYDPDLIERTLPVVQPYQIEPLNALASLESEDGTTVFDMSVDVELQAISQRQPNLHRLHQALQVHYRLPNEGSPVIYAKKFIDEGFVLGALTSLIGFNYPGEMAKGLSKGANDINRPSGYFHDIQSSTLALFENSENLELELLLQIMDLNTEPATELLREALDWRMALADGTPEQVASRKMGAITCYTVMSYERLRYREQVNALAAKNKKAAAKAKRIAEAEAKILAMPILASDNESLSEEKYTKVKSDKEPLKQKKVYKRKRFYRRHNPMIRFNKKMLELVPMNIRREVDAHQIERIYWDQINSKSSQTQKI